MNILQEYIRLFLSEWSDEDKVMVSTDTPVTKDLEAPEDENVKARDPYSNANKSLKTSKAQIGVQTQKAGVVRGSGRMGGGRFPGGPNQGVTGR